ncbi:MAG: polysaccharide biosynthesis/export family protein [Sinimarinibacterium sp.]
MTYFLRTLALAGLISLAACVSPAPQAKQSRSPPPPPPVVANPLDASVYRLGGGDVMRIDVLGEPELSLDALVDPSGFINYPFLGKIQASQLTVRDVEMRIRNGLRSGFLVNPDVRVALTKYRPVYIGGQVRQPGVYPYALGLNVERALTLAGGVTAFGSTGRIFVQRYGGPEGARVRAELDAPVFPGDYIIIEERLF